MPSWFGTAASTRRTTRRSPQRCGLLYLELHAQGAAVDLHSGTFGGVAPNPINTLARIIGELKDRNGHITVPGFYDHVQPPSPEELAIWKLKDKRYIEAILKA